MGLLGRGMRVLLKMGDGRRGIPFESSGGAPSTCCCGEDVGCFRDVCPGHRKVRFVEGAVP